MDPDRARELLAVERERIERELAALRHDDPDTDPEEAEPGDLGSQDLYQDEFDATQADDLREQLAAVERAEERLEAGTFGRSIESGEPIPDARLETLPTAERTVEEEERGGRS